MADEAPPQPQTVQLPALTDRALLEDLARTVRGGFLDVNQRLEHQDVTLDALIVDARGMNQRLAGIEGRVATIETGPRMSDRVRAITDERVSAVELKHEAKLGEEIAARLQLASEVSTIKAETASIKAETALQTKILTDTAATVSKFVATPAVKVAGGVLFGVLATYLANHYGIHIQ